MPREDQTGVCQTTPTMFARVRFVRDIDGVPAGELGTVVHVYPDGAAYEVEFNDCCVVTCQPQDLEVLHG